jgi:aminoacrylate peracid reductase
MTVDATSEGRTRRLVTLPARPEPIRVAVEETAAIVAFNHIFLTDWADYPAMNAVHAEYFPGAKPARYCIQCGLVKPGLAVEIASMAHLG